MALILASVTDKTGLVDFAKKLVSGKEAVDFLASGGTARTLEEGGIAVKKVADFTGSPEMLDGRVKTLHPNIHGALLARNTKADLAELSSLGIKPIDILVCNLYAFEKTVARAGSELECIENIDIGGVALLRAAAKNFERVTVLCEPSDYDRVAEEFLQKGFVSLETRRALAAKAFALCTRYDAAITDWFTSGDEKFIHGHKIQDLRYGENPHQAATLYSDKASCGVLGGKLLQGKELSYNNILDTDAAWRAVSIFDKPAAVVVKHLTPCGIAELGSDEPASLHKAVAAAIACDPVSAYGGIIAVNSVFDTKALEAFGDLFVECLIAPKFTDEVKKLLVKKKNWRIIEAPLPSTSQTKEFRSVLGGFLVQDVDHGDPTKTQEYKVATKRKPTEKEFSLLGFAWKSCTLVKSNAILLASFIDVNNPKLGTCTVGIGCGQPNRVDAARHAIARAGEKAKLAVLASDAFMPFPDTVQVAAQAGVSAIIQPGGSIRDNLSIDECNKNNIAMLFTGVRHFKH
ncbi:MAG: bifunctional phosphoribosylaminoimidazolecarboxamide formyltransferase/IMP cyclohydrolase [Treponemataceae bacterium]